MFPRASLSHEAELKQNDAAAYVDMLEVVSLTVLCTFSDSTDQSESENFLLKSNESQLVKFTTAGALNSEGFPFALAFC